MYLHIKIRHNVIIQCHGNYFKVENFNCMLEIDILRNYCPRDLSVLKSNFWGFGCPRDAQTPCWFRLCYTALVQKSWNELVYNDSASRNSASAARIMALIPDPQRDL